MMRLEIDHDELRPLIDQAVDAAVRRLEDERPTDQAARVLLTKREASEALGVSESTIDRLRRDAGLPFLKLDGKVLFRPEALKEWAAAKEEAA